MKTRKEIEETLKDLLIESDLNDFISALARALESEASSRGVSGDSAGERRCNRLAGVIYPHGVKI